MKVIKSPIRIQDTLKVVRNKGKRIGFVPTMGALHEGHLSLIRAARKDCNIVVVSIFVNPAQFSPREDLKRYPRPIKKDLALCRKERVDFIFQPDAGSMYPAGFSTYVFVKGLDDSLCGKSRPGHFRGVTTIVAKLFNIIQPDVAYFGQKDAQQAIIISKMVRDLDIPVKIKVMPIVRDKDGLALSSRNIYLSKTEREDARVLSRSLNLGKCLIGSGLRDTQRVTKRIKELIIKKNSARIDYVEIVNLDDLRPLKRITGDCLVALAVYFGKTRLIDNSIIHA